MKKNFAPCVMVLLAVLTFWVSLCSAATPPDHYMVTYTLKYTYTKDSLDRFWKQKKIPQIVDRVRYAVDM